MIESPLLSNLQGCIDGRWTDADSGEAFAVINPADGSHLANLPWMGADETGRAIEAAQSSLQAASSIEERREWLKGISQALLEDKHELARIVTLEHGKPLKEAVVEVEYSAGFFQFFDGTAYDILSTHDPLPVMGRILVMSGYMFSSKMWRRVLRK